MKPRDYSMENLPAWLEYNREQSELHLERKLGVIWQIISYVKLMDKAFMWKAETGIENHRMSLEGTIKQ